MLILGLGLGLKATFCGLGLGLGLRDLALAKKLRPIVLWDYKSHLGFNCRRILFSELYFKIRVPALK